MDIDPIMDKERNYFPGQGTISNRHVLADVWVVRASELGINDNTIHARTHLGHVLKPGDSVLGYNVENSNINDANFEKIAQKPDVILVKKYYGDRASRRKQRAWKLKHLTEEQTAFNTDAKYFIAFFYKQFSYIVIFSDYNEFLDDLEEDVGLRQNINIFKDKTKQIPVDEYDDFDVNEPHITLEEMLDDLVIEDVEMAE